MIKLKNVTKSFKDKKALDNLSLNVNSGEIYGLLGANGAGKSTALNLLLGFLDSDSGSIEISNSNDKKVVSRDMIGYIPENVNLYPYLSGIENFKTK
jgi:ABC-2 type transport system ATP-binding protein